MVSPFSQFEITVLQKINPILDLSITNFTIYITIITLITLGFYNLSINSAKLIPTNYQQIIEIFYTFILSLVVEQTNKNGLRYFPILFFLFNFLLASNLLGLFPWSFTITAQIIFTAFLSLSFFSGWIIQGIIFLKQDFIRIFIPRGIPGWLLPLLVVIEILSFLIRPLSLSIRLFANMLAGHILLFILASSIFSLGIFGILPFTFILAFLVLEIGICFLQAYVFTILLAIYLSDSFKAH